MIRAWIGTLLVSVLLLGACGGGAVVPPPEGEGATAGLGSVRSILPAGVKLDGTVVPEPRLDRVVPHFELTLENPSGSPQVSYTFDFPPVERHTARPLVLEVAGRRMYEVRPKKGFGWGDLVGVPSLAPWLRISGLEGAGEEISWGLR